MSEINQLNLSNIDLDLYLECLKENNYSKLNIDFNFENLLNSKSARKKEIKRVTTFQQKLLKQTNNTEKVNNILNIENLSNTDYKKFRQNQFKEYNINPYPHFFQTNYNLVSFEDDYGYLQNDELVKDKQLMFTGRIVSKRVSSKKLYFYTIESNEKNLQVLSTLFHYSDKEDFTKINTVLSIGDFIGVNGFAHRSKTGELSIVPTELQLLSPCLNQLPKYVKDSEGKDISTYTNKESRFRNRHIDWLLNPTNREILKTRSKIIRFIRNYFDSKDFYEVETPTLNIVSAGANAKPFTTHINAFNMPMYLRIAPELKLKQMIIGGFDKVYEIGKQFRNEDVDKTHLPEFTSIEFYERGADYYTLMNTTEELLSSLVKSLTGNYKVNYNIDFGEKQQEVEIDFTPPFKKIDMKDSLQKYIIKEIPDFEYPNDMFSDEARLYFSDIVDKLGIECSPPRTTARIIDKLVGHFIEPECINPTFIINHFQVMSPLAKYHRDNKELTERFELFVATKELCNAFTELNDPEFQQKLFEAQVEDKKLGDDEAQMKDDVFIDALNYGLPPTGGWGMGIDRLVMFLTNQNTIREVVTYPTMKPL